MAESADEEAACEAIREEEERRLMAERLRDVLDQLNERGRIVRGEAGVAEGRRRMLLEGQLEEIEGDIEVASQRLADVEAAMAAAAAAAASSGGDFGDDGEESDSIVGSPRFEGDASAWEALLLSKMGEAGGEEGRRDGESLQVGEPNTNANDHNNSNNNTNNTSRFINTTTADAQRQSMEEVMRLRTCISEIAAALGMETVPGAQSLVERLPGCVRDAVDRGREAKELRDIAEAGEQRMAAVERLEGVVSEGRAERVELERRLEEAERRLAMAVSAGENNVEEAKEEEREMHVQEMKEEVMRLEREMKQGKAEVIKVKEETESARKEYERAWQILRDLKSKAADKEMSLERLERQGKETKDALEEEANLLEAVVFGLKERAASLEVTLRERERDMGGLEGGQSGQRLEERIVELKGRKSELEGHIAELEGRNIELERRNTELEGRNSELGGRNIELERRNSELERRKSELEGQSGEQLVGDSPTVSHAANDAGHAASGTWSSVPRRVGAATSGGWAVHVDERAVSEEVWEAEEEAGGVIDGIRASKKEWEEGVAMVEEREMRSVISRVGEARKNAEEIERENGEAEADLKEVREELGRVGEMVGVMERRREALELSIGVATDALESAKQEMCGVQKELDEARRRLTEAEAGARAAKEQERKSLEALQAMSLSMEAHNLSAVEGARSLQGDEDGNVEEEVSRLGVLRDALLDEMEAITGERCVPMCVNANQSINQSINHANHKTQTQIQTRTQTQTYTYAYTNTKTYTRLRTCRHTCTLDRCSPNISISLMRLITYFYSGQMQSKHLN